MYSFLYAVNAVCCIKWICSFLSFELKVKTYLVEMKTWSTFVKTEWFPIVMYMYEMKLWMKNSWNYKPKWKKWSWLLYLICSLPKVHKMNMWWRCHICLSILSHVSSPELICLMTIDRKLWVQFHFDSYWLYITPSLYEAHVEPVEFLKSSSSYKNLYITWNTHLNRSFHLKYLWCRAYLTEWKEK